MKTRFSVAILLTMVAFGWAPVTAGAQLIPVKTIPLAETEQFAFFPTAGRSAMSMALVDSLLDPFTNPAKGSLIPRSQYFGAPSFFSVTGNAGGGTTFPMGGMWKRGSMFAGLSLAFQQIDRPAQSGFFGPLFDPISGVQTAGPQPASSNSNRYAFGMLGTTFDSSRTSLAASVLWSNLSSVDGADQFYDGNASLQQLGDAIDVRLGATHRLRGGQSIEAMLFRNQFSMQHEVGFVDFFWDPATRMTRPRSRTEFNADRSKVWGAHLEFEHPLDSGWRLGALATTNLIEHPRIPSYAITSGLGSQGRATAFNFGLGLGHTSRLTSFGLDAIFEPISNTSWIKDTVDNHFTFRNAKVRGGVSRDFPMLTPGNYMRVHFGGELHFINYRLRQDDRVSAVTRNRSENWLERGKSGGISFITSGLQLHYLVNTRNGVGRPGVINESDTFFGPDILSSAAWGVPNIAPVGLGAVSMTRHMFSISVPVR